MKACCATELDMFLVETHKAFVFYTVPFFRLV
jgi:hypothetical protein